MRIRFLIIVLALLTALSRAQNPSDKSAPGTTPSNPAAPDKPVRPSPDAEASSSRDTRIDVSPPKDDDKLHPSSKAAVSGLEPSDNPDASGVEEFHPWNPMKALKDIEVGNYYFKLKNYKAALARYQEALYYKDGDALASFRIAECQEKLGDKADAKKYYEQYLKILPEGPYAKTARASLEKLGGIRAAEPEQPGDVVTSPPEKTPQ